MNDKCSRCQDEIVCENCNKGRHCDKCKAKAKYVNKSLLIFGYNRGLYHHSPMYEFFCGRHTPRLLKDSCFSYEKADAAMKKLLSDTKKELGNKFVGNCIVSVCSLLQE